MNFSYTLDHGVTCLLKTSTIARAEICLQPSLSSTQDSQDQCITQNCKSVSLPFDYRRFDSFSGTWLKSGLRGGTSYAYSGVISYGNFKSCDRKGTFKTPVGIPAASPRNIIFTPPDDPAHQSGEALNFTLSWQPPSYDDQNGDITHYLLAIGDSRGNRTILLNDTDTRTYTEVYNSSETYSFALSACTVMGCGPYANGTYKYTENKHLTNSSDSRTNKGMSFLSPRPASHFTVQL